MALLGELRRRNVFKVGAAYAIVAWLLIQIAATLLPVYGAPAWVLPAFSSVVILGFPVALVLAWAYELTPEGIKRTEAVPSSERGSRAGGRKLGYAIAGLLALAVVFLLVDRFVPEANLAGPDEAGAGKPAESRVSVAVLPFRNLSSDPDQAYFADGLSEQLLNGLKQVPELRVTERASAFAFKDSDRPLREIAQVLGVDNVLDGSVRRDGKNVRVAAELTHVADGAQLWSKTYDFQFDDIFAIQDEITQSVATALSVSLGVIENRTPGMTRNVDAYDEFLQANGLMSQFSVDAMRAQIEHYQRAIALDRQFVLAIVGLGAAYSQGTLLEPARAQEWRQKSDEAFALARSLMPDAPVVLNIDASEAIQRGDWGTADKIYAELTKNPSRSGLLYEGTGYGAFLLNVGRTEDAIEILERVRAANPLDWRVRYGLGDAYASTGDLRRALAELDSGLELEETPNRYITGDALFVALASRDRSQIERRLAAMPSDPTGLYAAMERDLDDPAAAIAEIRRRADTLETVSPLLIGILAHWAAYFEVPELALELMQRIPTDSGFTYVMLWAPGMREVRALPGFRDLVTRMGLVAYWREYGWPDYCRPLGDKDFQCN